ncbi:hypothetical protein SAMN03159297_05575, partial [Pseudomonas sp. NFACC45]
MDTDDDIEKDESGENTIDMEIHDPAFQILSPSGYIPESTFIVSGVGARPGVGVMILDASTADSLGAGYDVNSDGSWTVHAAMRNESDLRYVASQTAHGITRPKTVVRRPTTLTRPQSNGVVAPSQVVFGGECFPGETPIDPGMRIRVLDGTTELASVTAVGPGTTWEATATGPLPGKIYTVRAEYKVESSPVLSYTNNLSFEVLGPPTITASTANQDMSFTVYGTKGKAGASVQVRLDVLGTPVGQGRVESNGSWSAPVQVPPGTVSLVAEQTYQNVPSGLSTAQAFKVRPPKLTAVTVTTPTDTSVKFEGSGYTGATVQITVVSGPSVTAPAPAPVNGDRWNTTATNWPFGSYSLRAIQRFPDGDNGWIDSLPYTFPVNLILPDPTDITYTAVYRPVFSGKGFNGATVKILNPDDSPAAPEKTVSGGVWSSMASTEWGPTFKRKVKIKQFKDGQESPTWQEIEVSIPPQAPVMDAPVENGLSPNLSGTCWPGAVLTLTFSDSPTEHPVNNDNGTW